MNFTKRLALMAASVALAFPVFYGANTVTTHASSIYNSEYPELDVNPKDISGGSINDNNPIEVGDTVLEDLGWNTANSSTF